MNGSAALLKCTGIRKAFPKPDGGELLVLEGMDLEIHAAMMFVMPDDCGRLIRPCADSERRCSIRSFDAS